MKVCLYRLAPRQTNDGPAEDPARSRASRSRERGYVLIVMMLFLTLLAIGLTAVAPSLAQRVRREREIELIHRGRQYARAMRLYYRKFGRYPVRLEELDNTNNIRFLRKRYKDPITGDGEWRLLHYGEAHFTQPNANPVMPGATTPGGSAVGPGSPSSPFANTFSSSPAGSPQPGQANPTQSQPGATPGQTGTTPGQTSPAQSGTGDPSQSQSGQPGTPVSQISSQPGGGPTFGGGPVVGVSSKSKKQSIKVLNQKDHYNDWEFVYDPRLDLNVVQALAGTVNQPNAISPGVQVSPGLQPGVGQPGPTSPGMPVIQPTKTQ